jgi:two-component system NtrC family sensor kinase
MSSLRQKITLGYMAFAVLLVGLSLRSLIELHQIEKQIKVGGRIAEFFDVALEIRRFEKNFFLYHQVQDVQENAIYLARARQLLDENRPTFVELAPEIRIAALRSQLGRYAAQMAAYIRHPQDATIERSIRALGLDIVNSAQTLANAERGVLQLRLEQHRRALLFTLAGLLVLLTVAAFMVSRSMVQPLKEMEDSMDAIAAGSTDKLALAAGHREMDSLVRASNHMLDELRRRQQQQLIQTERLASLGRLISGVAHEINNPLSNISSSAQILLEEDASADPLWQHKILNQIDGETARAQRIVRSLLDYAHKRDFQSSALSLHAVMEETLRFFRNEIPAQVHIQLDIPAALQVMGDKPRLQQVFLNLLKNGVDAMEGTGELHISARLDGSEVEIVFKDTGPGIASEVLPHIYEPFYSTKAANLGSGMGLFIAHEIVEEHGGSIRAANAPGTGALFFIRLPSAPT